MASEEKRGLVEGGAKSDKAARPFGNFHPALVVRFVPGMCVVERVVGNQGAQRVSDDNDRVVFERGVFFARGRIYLTKYRKGYLLNLCAYFFEAADLVRRT